MSEEKRKCKFTVLGDPVGKQRPQFNRHTGTAHTPNKTIVYETMVALNFKQENPRWKMIEKGIPISFNMIAYFGIPESWSKKHKERALQGIERPCVRPDLDNIAKMKDGLNKVAWYDDSQIVDEKLEKHYSDKPRLEVVIEEL